MARFGSRGRDAAVLATQSSGRGKFAAQFRWKDGEQKYIQFLTPFDDTLTCGYHGYIIVGYKDDGSPRYANFISRRDSQIDGPEGYDSLIDKFGQLPSKKTIGYAMEMEPIWETKGGRKIIKDFQIKQNTWTNKDGEEQTGPAVGLIIESPSTFWSYPIAYTEDAPLEDRIWRIKRVGGDKNTDYHFFDVGEALDLSEVADPEIERLDDYLDELVDEDRMRRLIGNLPADAKISKFPSKGKNEGDGKKSAKVKAEPEQEYEESEPEEPEEKAPAPKAKPKAGPTARKTRRFADLKKEVEEG